VGSALSRCATFLTDGHAEMKKKSRGSRRPSEELFTITFQRAEDVVEFDERCQVPPHDERESLDTERWILGRYLRALAAAGSLAYPLTATHAKQSESPDFTLSMPGGAQIGLETTEASTPEAHRLFIKSEQPKGKAVLAGSEPAVGDAPEREWAANVCERIRKKAKGLASGRWTPADSYDLVLYENAPTSVGVDLSKALSILRAFLNAEPRSGFRTVSIIAESFTRLIYLEGDSRRSLSIPWKRA
jgi:hypothetical protein